MANSGTTKRIAIIIGDNTVVFNCIPEYDKTIFAKIEFELEKDSLYVNLTDGS